MLIDALEERTSGQPPSAANVPRNRNKSAAKSPDNLAFLSLHRYYIWADRMRVHFDNVLRQPEEVDHSIDARLYMSYWYAGTYVVIDGWRELGMTDPAVDDLLTSSNVDLLRRFRNGVFHFQKDYDDERFLGLIRDGENVAEWIRRLNTELGRCLLSKVQKLEA